MALRQIMQIGINITQIMPGCLSLFLWKAAYLFSDTSKKQTNKKNSHCTVSNRKDGVHHKWPVQGSRRYCRYDVSIPVLIILTGQIISITPCIGILLIGILPALEYSSLENWSSIHSFYSAQLYSVWYQSLMSGKPKKASRVKPSWVIVMM